MPENLSNNITPIEVNNNSISSSLPGGIQIITQAEFEKLTSRVDDHKRQLSITLTLLIGVVLILLVSFVTFLLDSYKVKTETYHTLIEKIESIDNKNKEDKINALNQSIERLQKQLDDNEKNKNLTNKSK